MVAVGCEEGGEGRRIGLFDSNATLSFFVASSKALREIAILFLQCLYNYIDKLFQSS